jgi:hypothetical protein
MNSALHVIQETTSSPEKVAVECENLAATHLIIFFKKLKVQKIFQIA